MPEPGAFWPLGSLVRGEVRVGAGVDGGEGEGAGAGEGVLLLLLLLLLLLVPVYPIIDRNDL